MRSMAVAKSVSKSVSPILVPLSESSQTELSELLKHHVEASLFFRFSGHYQEENDDIEVQIRSELHLKHKDNTSHYSTSNIFRKIFIPFLKSIGIGEFTDSLEAYLDGNEKLAFVFLSDVPKGKSKIIYMFEVEKDKSLLKSEEGNKVLSPIIRLISSGGSDIPDYSYFISLLRAYGGPEVKTRYHRYLYGFDLPGEENKTVLIVNEKKNEVSEVSDIGIFFSPKKNRVEEELSGVKSLISKFSGAKSFKEEDERSLYVGLNLLALYLQISGEVLKNKESVSDAQVSSYGGKKFRFFDFSFHLPVANILPAVITSHFKYRRKTRLVGYKSPGSHGEKGNDGSENSGHSAILEEEVLFRSMPVLYSKDFSPRITVECPESPFVPISSMTLKPDESSKGFSLWFRRVKARPPLFRGVKAKPPL